MNKKIYVASRASLPERPAMWRDLRGKGWPINSTWIDEAGLGETLSMRNLWARIVEEVTEASGVILYAEANDFPLKGAILECGIAIGQGKPIGVVLPGEFPFRVASIGSVGSWLQHPLVCFCSNLNDARQYIEEFDLAPDPATGKPVGEEVGGG